MAINTASPWHKRSFDEFIHDRLRRLLETRVPLDAYHVEPAGPYRVWLSLELAPRTRSAVAISMEIAAPDDSGVFDIAGRRFVVLPIASSEHLDQAEVRCVGEQLLEEIESRVGDAPADLVWDAALARTWLPIDVWIADFIRVRGQPLDSTNWLSRATHLRRLSIPDRREVITHSQIGRTCPFETPEGINIGKLLHIAAGAEIRDGRVTIVDDRPEAALGVSAMMVPLLQHNDPNRQLMGANMMRQWLPTPDAEPALVQTGHEPDPAPPEFWCGRNLLTAFTSMGAHTHEDGIVVSESAAKRLGHVRPLEPGDKLSNRHGTKGTIARILPDAQMPHTPDGTAVELVFSFIALHTRQNFGQVREAVLGRIARAQNKPVISPPFAAVSSENLKQQLAACGFEPSGLVQLTDGRGGKPIARASTVGWVYWGKTHHLASDKLAVSPADHRGQRVSEFEFYALRDIGAAATINDLFSTQNTARAGARDLPELIAREDPAPAATPSPAFAELSRRLECVGISAEFDGAQVRFAFAASPPAGAVELARPMPHPWCHGRTLTHIAPLPTEVAEWSALIAANERLARLARAAAPQPMIEHALEQLRAAAERYCHAVLTPEHLRPGNPVMFSGRAVLAGGPELALDQVGIPEEMALALFAPQLRRHVGHEAIESRSREARAALDDLLARRWVLVHRAPTLWPASIVALRPIVTPERVVRLPLQVLMLLNADFDGDQAGVYLPITEAAQREAGERLTVAGHLRRDPGILRWLLPPHAAMWGLATLPRQQVQQVIGENAELSPGLLTARELERALRTILEKRGVDEALRVLQDLMRLGFEQARLSGATLGPFPEDGVSLPPRPVSESPDEWLAWFEQCVATVATMDDFDHPQHGSAILAIRAGARGNAAHLASIVIARPVFQANGDRCIARHSLVEGLSPQEMFARCMLARRAIAATALNFSVTRAAYGAKDPAPAAGHGVLARAMRSTHIHPGVVLARAADTEETDPLTDTDARLFVGV